MVGKQCMYLLNKLVLIYLYIFLLVYNTAYDAGKVISANIVF